MLKRLHGKLALKEGSFGYQWASDVEFDGIRLEVLAESGETLFDVSVPEHGPRWSTRSRERCPQT
jgi:hypothetical protein